MASSRFCSRPVWLEVECRRFHEASPLQKFNLLITDRTVRERHRTNKEWPIEKVVVKSNSKIPYGKHAGQSGEFRMSAVRFTFAAAIQSGTSIAAALIFVSSAMLATNAQAWGADGHRLVAEAAEAQLSAPARAEVTRLLALEPGATLSSISTWADEVRAPSTGPWHYVNFPRDADCSYSAEQMCMGGSCVVGAIDRQVAVLASKAPDEDRLKALKYVVHFVADVHQPLHAGFADDRGGNSYQLQAYGRGTNLHALWDSGLIRQWPGGLPALRAAVAASPAPASSKLAPAAWAVESCRVVSTAGYYPVGRQLDSEYGQRWSAKLTQRIAFAAQRLTAVLNDALTRP